MTTLPSTTTTTTAELPAEIAQGSWGAVEEMETTDLLVPKIFHQQGLSEFVKKGSAKAGDWCDSLTGDVLAAREAKLEVIVFGLYKTMIISKLDPRKNKFFFDKSVTLTRENAREWATMPFEMENNEGTFRYNLYYNFYCLLPNRIKDLPYVLSLGSTKTKAAKKLNSMMQKLSQYNRPSAAVVFTLQSVEESNDQGSWYGADVGQGRDATAEELLRVNAWYLKSKSQTIVASDSHDDGAIEA